MSCAAEQSIAISEMERGTSEGPRDPAQNNTIIRTPLHAPSALQDNAAGCRTKDGNDAVLMPSPSVAAGIARSDDGASASSTTLSARGRLTAFVSTSSKNMARLCFRSIAAMTSSRPRMMGSTFGSSGPSDERREGPHKPQRHHSSTQLQLFADRHRPIEQSQIDRSTDRSIKQ